MNYELDPILAQALAQWQPDLSLGIAALDSGDAAGAIDPLSRAVTASARFHPLFHFCESAQHTERGMLRLLRNDWSGASEDFTRAIFLDHTNQSAIEGKTLAETKAAQAPQPYTRDVQNWFATPPDSGLHMLLARVRLTREESLYAETIELTDATHRRYHQLAALPWLWRCRAFRGLGEMELAYNDCRRALDLDRANAEILEIRKTLGVAMPA